MYEESFLNLGFTKTEATIYLTLVEYGQTYASLLAKKLKMKRGTVYSSLNLLRNKGFVGICKRNNIFTYGAVDPEVLLEIQERKIRQDKYNVEHLAKVLSGLSVKSESKFSTPKVHFFNGEEGVKSLLADTLCAKEIIFRYSSFHLLQDEQFLKYLERNDQIQLYENETTLRLIAYDTPKNRDYWKKFSDAETSIRWLKKKFFLFDNEVFIYNDKIAIISFEEMFGVLLESPSMARMQKRLFELTWTGAKVVDGEEEPTTLL